MEKISNPRVYITQAAEHTEHAIHAIELALDALEAAAHITPGAPTGPACNDALANGRIPPIGDTYSRLHAMTRQLAAVSAHLGDEGE